MFLSFPLENHSCVEEKKRRRGKKRKPWTQEKRLTWNQKIQSLFWERVAWLLSPTPESLSLSNICEADAGSLVLSITGVCFPGSTRDYCYSSLHELDFVQCVSLVVSLDTCMMCLIRIDFPLIRLGCHEDSPASSLFALFWLRIRRREEEKGDSE